MSQPLILEPFLQFSGTNIYNPLTGTSVDAGSAVGATLSDCVRDPSVLAALPPEGIADLVADGWIVEDDGDLDRRFVLRYVSLESHTVCNQACYFCPVSTAPREHEFMSDDAYRAIVEQLAAYVSTIRGVFMMSYNEPTLDPRFVEQVALLRSHGLPPAVNSNGTGLTPDRVLEIRRAGGLVYLEVNLSTLDREQYERDRGGDHLASVLRNLDYLAKHPVSSRMEISVLGHNDAQHHRTELEIRRRYADSPFRVRSGWLMNRAGHVDTGRRPSSPVEHLRGCDNTGSRTVEHLHITPQGQCVICCQDYFGKYVVGDLTRQRLDEVLTGDEFSRMRRWTYGLEQAPSDFICRGCVFAVEAPSPDKGGVTTGQTGSTGCRRPATTP